MVIVNLDAPPEKEIAPPDEIAHAFRFRFNDIDGIPMAFTAPFSYFQNRQPALELTLLSALK